MTGRLSVVMPVRDLAPYVDASISSILDQSFGDFEFIIRDDGSRDGTREILRGWARRDARIKLFESDTSLGPAESSNWVVAQASGDLVARMDGDDVAHPDRLRRQVEALDRDPDACLVGTLWEGIDEKGRRVRPRDRWRLAHPSAFAPFPHGSIMFRRAAFERVGGYRTEANFWEDLDLYRRLSAVGRLIVLPQALYRHRSSVLSTRLASPPEQVEASVDRMYRQVNGLPARPASGAGARLLPQVFLSLGSTRLWAGRSPRMLRRLLRRSALRLDRASAGILLWALWGSVSPGTLRFSLRSMARLRDFTVRKRFPDDSVYVWDCPSAASRPASPAPAAEPAAAVLTPAEAKLRRQA
ncbi:MAG: glycosyltransferase family 2 protein [Alphaproteobacteria bacterium]|nr:glycosyltransferase family 2 protein [Alphaproteobacteria bacterium]MBV9372529.1 glycosyltransferase family 2 protein [Alphaproteobacteria bacterium]MBV9902242.1 glycosyltransferase family 2 protein [Alphaproteobacteria bacterium]